MARTLNKIHALAEAFAPQVHTATAPTWRLLPYLLLLAFVLRAAVALSGDFIVHPDETMQYREMAHGLVFGNAIMFWPQYYGGQSWLLPGMVAGVLLLCKWLGLGEPAYYIPAVKLFFCLFSLLIPLCMYIIGRRLFSEHCARIALLFGVFWYELVGLAHKPMKEFVATNVLLLLFVLVLRPQRLTPAQAAVATLVGVFATALRFQYAPLAAVALLPPFLRGDMRVRVWMVVAATAMVGAVGALEYFTWGSFLHSYWINLLFNFELQEVLRKTYHYGGYYLLWLPIASGGLVLLAVAALRQRQCLFLLLLALAFLIPHEVLPHHEYRYVYVLIPLWLLLCAAFVCTVRWRLRLPLLGWAALASAAGIANALPMQEMLYNHLSVNEEYAYNWRFLRGQDALLPLYVRLAADDSVRGVKNELMEYTESGGYFYLHRKVPLYSRSSPHAPEEVLSHISHIITAPPLNAPEVVRAADGTPVLIGTERASALLPIFIHDAAQDKLVHWDTDGKATVMEAFAIAERGTQYTLWKRTPPAPVHGWQSYRLYVAPLEDTHAPLLENKINTGKPPPPYYKIISAPPAERVGVE